MAVWSTAFIEAYPACMIQAPRQPRQQHSQPRLLDLLLGCGELSATAESAEPGWKTIPSWVV